MQVNQLQWYWKVKKFGGTSSKGWAESASLVGIELCYWSEKPKKLDKTSFNDNFFEWYHLHLTALTKENYFNHYKRGSKFKSIFSHHFWAWKWIKITGSLSVNIQNLDSFLCTRKKTFKFGFSLNLYLLEYAKLNLIGVLIL